MELELRNIKHTSVRFDSYKADLYVDGSHIANISENNKGRFCATPVGVRFCVLREAVVELARRANPEETDRWNLECDGRFELKNWCSEQVRKHQGGSFSCVCKTNGHGLWSSVRKSVRINKISVPYIDDYDFGELRAYFDRSEWYTEADGLIYTDPCFLEDFRDALVKAGFSRAAANDVEYSEAGMQGDDYVSFDVTGKFLSEVL